MAMFINLQDQRIQLSSNPVMNVWSKIYFYSDNIQSHKHVYVDTNVFICNLPQYSIGTPLFLNTAVSPTPMKFTKLTKSLIQLCSMMSARLSKHKFAEKYQVKIYLKNFRIFQIV